MDSPDSRVGSLVQDIVDAVDAGDDCRIDRLLSLLVSRAGLADLDELRARLIGC
ncbi:hypothetical protein [Streptomyces virginiae]|uniref:hypothetical protein n=1 Tax=Streptomyces virginiae TaxID=1961 RepID=UPI00131DD3BE|nr:hypothetical protein [Streptomyces virginiae]